MRTSIDELTGRIPVRSREPGALATARAVLDLPPMTPVEGAGPDGLPDGETRGWVSTDPVADPDATWRRWARAFDRTGLWPLRAAGIGTDLWLAPPAEPEDAGAVLAACWAGCTPVLPDGTLLPHPPWPGLAPGRGAADPSGVVLPRDLAPPWSGRLLLVPAPRPADTPARLGWYGAGNRGLSAAAVSGVLRSWEDRFGAYLLAVGSATLDLVVTRPPATARQLDLVAHEHLAFCPDNSAPQTGPDDRLIPHAEYAARLRTASTWHFWWD
jgi:hypothetical protein